MGVRHLHVAVHLLAERVHAFRACLHLRRQVVLPALDAESVAAGKGEAGLLVQLLVADGAVATVHLGERSVRLRVGLADARVELEAQSVLQCLLLSEPSVHLVLVPLVMPGNDDELVEVHAEKILELRDTLLHLDADLVRFQHHVGDRLHAHQRRLAHVGHI